MSNAPKLHDFSWDRMIRGVALVRERVERVVAALNAAGVEYAIAGECASAEWVSRIDESAVRNFRDVDVMVPPSHAAGAINAMEQAGFHSYYDEKFDALVFHDCQDSSRTRIHGVVRLMSAHRPPPAGFPTFGAIEPNNRDGRFPIVALPVLVRRMLTSHRTLDQVCLRDLIDVSLVDASWPARLPPPLDDRLQALLDDPDG